MNKSQGDRIIEITDFNDERLDVYARLSEGQLLNRHEPEKGIFIAESPIVIERALEAGCKPISMLVEDKHIETQAKELIAKTDVPVFTASFEVLANLTGFELTRGMLCAMHRPAPLEMLKLLEQSKRLVVLENVMNPTNVGAIFRSAAALNMDGIILANNCSNPLYRRAIRVSMGTVFQIPWTIIDDVEWPGQGLEILRNAGFKNLAMALRKDTIDINDERLRKEDKLAIILGSEGTGLLEKTIDMCDYTVKIPMAHGVDSLNVAAASAVAFWELGRQ